MQPMQTRMASRTRRLGCDEIRLASAKYSEAAYTTAVVVRLFWGGMYVHVGTYVFRDVSEMFHDEDCSRSRMTPLSIYISRRYLEEAARHQHMHGQRHHNRRCHRCRLHCQRRQQSSNWPVPIAAIDLNGVIHRLCSSSFRPY